MTAMPSFQLESCRSGTSEVFALDPLRDPRWNDFVGGHPHASVFHSLGWLKALYRTYGYEPLVATSARPGERLSNGIIVCKVKSWATAGRLVSLPFSDHCDPLVSDSSELLLLVNFLKGQLKGRRFRYLEMRPLQRLDSATVQGLRLDKIDTYCIHTLDLRPGLDEVYRKFHKSCVQRKIQKAERAGLLYEEGSSEELLTKFYKLLLRTRRRHQLPPQSMAWFRNLALCLGDQFKVRVASKDGQPVASIITLQGRDTGVYKYGCSDDRYHNLGGMFLLMWRAIQDARVAGAQFFDLGRSEQVNDGLITFKEHWGATRSPLVYFRYPAGITTHPRGDWKLRLIQKMCPYLPDRLLETLGTALYKHVG